MTRDKLLNFSFTCNIKHACIYRLFHTCMLNGYMCACVQCMKHIVIKNKSYGCIIQKAAL